MSFPGFPNPNGHVPVGTGQQVPTTYNNPYRQQLPQNNNVVVVVYEPPQFGPNAVTVYRDGRDARQIPHQARHVMRGRVPQEDQHIVNIYANNQPHHNVNRQNLGGNRDRHF